jgi:hypothetical protein
VINGNCCQYRKWSSGTPAKKHVIHDVPHPVIDCIQCTDAAQKGVMAVYGSDGDNGDKGRIVLRGKDVEVIFPLRSRGGSHDMRVVVDKKNYLNVERVRSDHP